MACVLPASPLWNVSSMKAGTLLVIPLPNTGPGTQQLLSKHACTDTRGTLPSSVQQFPQRPGISDLIWSLSPASRHSLIQVGKPNMHTPWALFPMPPSGWGVHGWDSGSFPGFQGPPWGVDSAGSGLCIFLRQIPPDDSHSGRPGKHCPWLPESTESRPSCLLQALRPKHQASDAC